LKTAQVVSKGKILQNSPLDSSQKISLKNSPDSFSNSNYFYVSAKRDNWNTLEARNDGLIDINTILFIK